MKDNMTEEELLELLAKKIEQKVQQVCENKLDTEECVKNHEFYWQYTDPTEQYKPRVHIPTENLRM